MDFMKAVGCHIIIWLIILVCWVGNIVKLCNDDFQAPYKTEILHGVGIIVPIVAPITVWF